ncbi:DUF3060 domain-containing protein [Lysobacter sp. H21R4]|nr:DUF3060 domain-containing protein [Lysobacter sp. H21R4]
MLQGLGIGACMALLVSCGGGHDADSSATTAALPSGVLTDPASGGNCAGNDLRISRDDFSMVIQGECGNVVISGSNGVLNLDGARSLRVEGNNVTVLNEQVGEVVVTGDDTTLNLTIAGPVKVDGDRNLVLAKDIQTLGFSGNDNTVNTDNDPALDDTGRGNRLL